MEQIEEDSRVGVLADGALGSLEVGGQATADIDNVLTTDPAKLKQWQQQHPSRKRARELAEGEQAGDNSRASFYYKEELLYRQWFPLGKTSGTTTTVS